jgi:aspartyl-tRNA(Asn)/glutamyl-tRNA(Gln) amidotransferase subunit C
MKITPDQVRHVAKLARLDLDPQHEETLSQQLASIIGYMDKLNEVNTEGITATSHASHQTNAFRQDQPHAHLSRDEALDNAPRKDEESFVVPKVI